MTKNSNSENISKAEVKTVFYKSEFFPFYIFLFLGSLILYGWTATFDFGMDDNLVYDVMFNINKDWQGFKTVLAQRFGDDYRPVTMTIFWLEMKIFGEFKPSVAHFLNAVFFGILLIQIFRLIIIGNFYSDKKQLIAFTFLTALIFMVHPMHISVVANIKSRDNLLSMLFGITAIIQFLYVVRDNKIMRLPLVFVFLLLAGLSKIDAYIFPFFALIYYMLYLFKAKHFKYILPFTLFIFPFIFKLPFYARDFISAVYMDGVITDRVYLDTPLLNNDSFVNRLSLALTTLLYYIKFFVLPFGHYVYYGYNQVPLTPLLSPLNILSFLIYISLFAFSVYKFKHQRIYIFSFLFYLLAIFYASNIPVIVSGILTDRYNFIGSLGMSMFAAALCVEYFKAIDWKIIFNKYILITLLIFTGFNYYRTSAWKDTETLFLRDIDKIKYSVHSHQMLSSIYLNDALFRPKSDSDAKAKMREAIKYIDRGLAVSQDNPHLLTNKGISVLFFKDPLGAIPYFRKAIAQDSTLTTNHNYIGVCHRYADNIDSALYYFELTMNKEEMFNYAASNFIEVLIQKERYASVDSVVAVLQKRFPYDSYLNEKVEHLHSKGQWIPF